MDGRILYRIDFDNMENHSPVIKKVVAAFASSKKITAEGKCSDYISKMEPVKLYKGYNGQVYPQFVIEPLNIQQENDSI